jgi:hypothetical protein
VLSKEDMEEFKDAVVGSALKKADLSKGLKSRYVITARVPNYVQVLTEITDSPRFRTT